MVRWLTALAAAGAAGAALFHTAAAAPSRPSARAPVSLSRPFLQHARSHAADTVQISSQAEAWRSPGGLQLRFSWLECDLKGKHCSPLPGLSTRSIIPPQELRVVTLRGVVTATNDFGSTSVTTSNFDYDMAGLAFDHRDRRYVQRHPQYDPDQVRARYGLGAEQNGAGQTIVIPDVGRKQGLRTAVDHFSVHYGLPRPCGKSASPGCFELVISQAGRAGEGIRTDEGEADVEWVHAVAPEAKIVVLRFGFGRVATVLEEIRELGRAGRVSVVSNSWCAPCSGYHAFARHVVFPHIAAACQVPHVVCVQATGDHGMPGTTPSNSRYVLAAGGTRFRTSSDGAMGAEVPWQRSGFGDTDVPVPRPAWQRNVDVCSHKGGVLSCAKRAVPDVSATAANVPVYRPTRTGFSWSYFYGTSLSAPLWAGLIALTDQSLQEGGQAPVGVDELHHVLYRGYVAGGLNDIPPAGWDWATGLGSPRAGIVGVLTQAIERYRQQR